VTIASPRSGFDLEYYLERAGEKTAGGYYLNAAQQGEPPGRWFGKGAEALGFADGQLVERDPYLEVYQQRDPVTGEKLGRAPNGWKRFSEIFNRKLAAEPHATRALVISAVLPHGAGRLASSGLPTRVRPLPGRQQSPSLWIFGVFASHVQTPIAGQADLGVPGWPPGSAVAAQAAAVASRRIPAGCVPVFSKPGPWAISTAPGRRAGRNRPAQRDGRVRRFLVPAEPGYGSVC
jgi:hypothetical protein